MSVAGAARKGMRVSPTSNAPSGWAEILWYQRPFPPRTERTKTSSPATTAQMIVRCSGESTLRLVSMYTSSASSRRLKVSGSKELFTILSTVPFVVHDLAERFSSRTAAGARSTRLLVGIAKGDRGPHHLVPGYAE